MSHHGPPLRRLIAAALLALTALALVPVSAGAAQAAKVRLLDVEPAYSSVVITATDGSKHTGAPGLMRLRVTPSGGVATDRPGFCADLKHVIGEGRDYDVVTKTASDLPALASARHGEAAWLIQQAEAMIAARPASSRALEAGALQVAVWQLVGEARETAPTSDAALNARVAQIRLLAAGRAIGGPLTVVPDMPRGCAGRGSVRMKLTGVPGSSATLTATGASGVVSPAEVRFAADGTASAAVSSATGGTVTVTVRASGGTLTRIARGTSGATTPQETMVLNPPAQYAATATIVFENCPAVPLEEDTGTPVVPTTPTTPTTPATPPGTDSPVAPLETPTSAPVSPPVTTPAPAPPAESIPREPTQTTPRLRLLKTGPARATAGARTRYTIRVTNRGTARATGITVTDRLPEGMSLASVPAGARLRGGRVIWTIGALRAGATRVLNVSVRFDADISGRRCNRATAALPGGTTVAATACTRVVSLPRTLLPAVTA